MARHTELASLSPRPSRSVFVAESVGGGRRMFGSRRLGPLFAVVAPLVARKLVESGAAAAFSAWPLALRELVAYLSPGRRVSWFPRAS